MSLRYILGNINSGKTFSCIKEIIDKANNNKENILLYIVPEQFSMESQRNILEGIENGVSMNVRVFGFKHFAYYLLSKCGTMNKVVLDNIDKAILLKKAAYELKRKNTEKLYYDKVMENQGFLDRLGSIITEFSQYEVSAEDFSQFALSLEKEGRENGDFTGKLKSIAALYTEYTRLLEGYVSADGLLDILYNILSSEKLRPKSLENAQVWIDAFNGFTPQEYRIIEALFKYTHSINITFTVDEPKTYYDKIDVLDPYNEIKSTINRLTDMAGKNNVSMSVCEQNTVLKNPQIQHLADNYFSFKPNKYNGVTDAIEIYSAKNKYEEIENLCHKIKNMVMTKGYKYSDIGIITGDNSYNIPLCHCLKKYDIPNFLDSRINVSNHILPEFILSALETITSGWSSKAILRHLKTGLVTDITKDSASIIENYIIAQGIEYSWAEPWNYGFKNYSDNYKELLNTFREKVYSSFKILLELSPVKKYTVNYISIKIFDFLKECDIQSKLNTASRNKTLERQEINRQVWKTVINVFEKMTDNLGEEKITLKEFSALLSTGISTATAGIVPPVQDSLVIGDIIRTRLPEIRALFILGANEGFVPPAPDNSTLITENEREKIAQLSAYKIVTAPETISKINQENLGIYFAITKPDQYLCLSYSRSNIKDDSQMYPSVVITKIKSFFNGLTEKYVGDNIKNLDELNAKRPAFERLIELISGNNIIGNDEKYLYKYFSQDIEPYSSELKRLFEIASVREKDKLSENSMNLLLSGDSESIKKINLSVSKLETYASCPFSYFLKYFLKINERAVYSLNSMDYGNIYHSLAENILKNDFEDISKNMPELLRDCSVGEEFDFKYSDYNKYISDYSNQYTEYKKFIYNYINKYTEKYTNELFDKDNFLRSHTAAATLSRIKNVATDYILASVSQFETSLFRPFDFEVSFGGDGVFPPIEIPLGNNILMNLIGKIDRVDIYSNNGTAYVNITDYKSKKHEGLKPSFSHILTSEKIENMLSMQLPTYLYSFVEFAQDYLKNKITLNTKDKKELEKYRNLKNISTDIKPCAMLYSEIFKPINTVNIKEKNLANKRSLYYGAEGIFLNSAGSALDTRNIEGEKEDFYNIKYINTNSKDFKNYSVACDDEHMTDILEKNRLNLSTLGQKITSGYIPVSPYEFKNGNETYIPCNFCPYAHICKKDIKEINFRKLPTDKQNS